MKNQHRMILATALSMVIIIGYSLLFPPPSPQENPGEGEAAAALQDDAKAGDAGSPGEDAAPADGENKAPDAAGPQAEQVELVRHTLQGEKIALEVRNGARGLVDAVHLLEERFLEPSEDGGEKGLDFLKLDEVSTLELGIDRSESDFEIPRLRAEVIEQSPTLFKVRRKNAKVQIDESIELTQGYEARYRVTIKNLGAESYRYRLKHLMRITVNEPSSQYDVTRGICAEAGDVEDFDWSSLDDGAETSDLKALRWVGVDSKYFLSAFVAAETMQLCRARRSAKGEGVTVIAEDRRRELEPNGQASIEYGLYFGPKSSELLNAFEVIPDAGLEDAIDWGWFGGLSKALGSMMLWLLRRFHDWTGIWGVAIILLTCVVKLITLPFTLKQYESMKAMRELSPELQKLQEQYGDDPVKLNQERQSLLSRKGVNPLAGCLPMLIQFPIWIALYAMLGTAVELYREPFLWLEDLTKPDGFNILPILMAGLMWLQIHMQPTAGDPQQQMVMKWVMPGVFLFMMWFLPSGLGIYILANIVLSLVQSYIQLRPERQKAKAAAKT